MGSKYEFVFTFESTSSKFRLIFKRLYATIFAWNTMHPNNVNKWAVADPGGGGGEGVGATGARPPKIGSTMFFNPIFIRMLKNKAQIARKHWNSPRASRALKRALDPCRKWVWFRARNVRAGT